MRKCESRVFFRKPSVFFHAPTFAIQHLCRSKGKDYETMFRTVNIVSAFSQATNRLKTRSQPANNNAQ